MPVNAEGEETAPAVPAIVHEKLIVEAAETIARLQGEAVALVNALTVLTIRNGGEVLVTPAELDALGHRFAMTQDPTTKVVKLTATRKDGAALALTARQAIDNRRAEEVALPKDRLVKPPSGIIIP